MSKEPDNIFSEIRSILKQEPAGADPADESSTGAVKFDGGKLDYSLVSKNSMDAIAAALGYGADKYGRYNYTLGFKYSRLLASLGRHLFKLQSGEDFDDESQCHHLCHIMANAQMMLDNISDGKLEDDRYKIVDNKLKLFNE